MGVHGRVTGHQTIEQRAKHCPKSTILTMVHGATMQSSLCPIVMNTRSQKQDWCEGQISWCQIGKKQYSPCLDGRQLTVISSRSTKTGRSANSKLDTNDVLTDVTSGRKNEAGMTLKKQSLSDLFILLWSSFPTYDELTHKFESFESWDRLLHQKPWPARLIRFYPNYAYVMIMYFKETPVIRPRCVNR